MEIEDMRDLMSEEVSFVDGAASQCDADGGDVLILAGLSIATGLGFAAGGVAGFAGLMGMLAFQKSLMDKQAACEANLK